MIQNQERFLAAISQFDALNNQDPNSEMDGGKSFPKEVLYAERMSKRLLLFYPEASEALQLAARSQHLCRWKIPRSDFPMGRTGYFLWRTKLKKFHAELAEEVMQDVAYSTEMIEKVKMLIQKKHLKKEVETQILEDVVCLVFLEFYFWDFAVKHSEEKVISILQKTWKKMSEDGQAAALKLPLTEKATALILKALA
jgi:hypothetical protein